MTKVKMQYAIIFTCILIAGTIVVFVMQNTKRKTNDINVENYAANAMLNITGNNDEQYMQMWKDMEYTSITDEYEFTRIPLDSAVRNVKKILYYKDKIYIASASSTIYIYDTDYNFISLFGGVHPSREDSFVFLSGMTAYNDKLYILDTYYSDQTKTHNNYIKVFDLDGNYIDKIVCNLGFNNKPDDDFLLISDIEILDDKYFYLSSCMISENAAMVYKVDLAGNLISSFGANLMGGLGKSHIENSLSLATSGHWGTEQKYGGGTQYIFSTSGKQAFYIFNDTDVLFKDYLSPSFYIDNSSSNKGHVYEYLDTIYNNNAYYVLMRALAIGGSAIQVFDTDGKYVKTFPVNPDNIEITTGSGVDSVLCFTYNSDNDIFYLGGEDEGIIVGMKKQ